MVLTSCGFVLKTLRMYLSLVESKLNTNSLSFDGENDFVDPQASFPDITNTFTMSMWAKPIYPVASL